MRDPSRDKSNGIPSWQLPNPVDTSATSKNPTNQQEPVNPRNSFEGTSLVEKAKKFLEDDDIRGASEEKKRLFLQSKGLTEAEIKELTSDPAAEAIIVDSDQKEKREDTEPAISNTESRSAEPSISSPSKHDSPPIITYPEFLLHSQRPPPLITARRLLTALYVASGAAATIYGTSKFIVEPMIESLTSARQSLSQSASANLDAFNLKLEGAVSKVPEIPEDIEDLEGSDLESSSSDPARFFSRSAGTQTSPRLSRSVSSASSNPPVSSPIEIQEDTLMKIQSKLSDLLPVDAASQNVTKDTLADLRKYLSGLSYDNYIDRTGGKFGEKGKLDEIAKAKAEIRNVKGVLLSARNFPSGVSVRS